MLWPGKPKNLMLRPGELKNLRRTNEFAAWFGNSAPHRVQDMKFSFFFFLVSSLFFPVLWRDVRLARRHLPHWGFDAQRLCLRRCFLQTTKTAPTWQREHLGISVALEQRPKLRTLPEPIHAEKLPISVILCQQRPVLHRILHRPGAFTSLCPNPGSKRDAHIGIFLHVWTRHHHGEIDIWFDRTNQGSEAQYFVHGIFHDFWDRAHSSSPLFEDFCRLPYVLHNIWNLHVRVWSYTAQYNGGAVWCCLLVFCLWLSTDLWHGGIHARTTNSR